MPEFTRQELYDLVWSEPIKTVAARFDISDVGLAKACRGANIPVPERGYWAKLKAGKPTHKVKLPPRGIGETDRVAFGGKRHMGREPISLDDPEPVMPVFPDDMRDIQTKVTALVGKVTVSRNLDKAHPAVIKLLEADAVRAKAHSASSYSWEKPLFESNFEKRRLRILSALMLSLQRAGARPSVSGREGRDIGMGVAAFFTYARSARGSPRLSLYNFPHRARFRHHGIGDPGWIGCSEVPDCVAGQGRNSSGAATHRGRDRTHCRR